MRYEQDPNYAVIVVVLCAILVAALLCGYITNVLAAPEDTPIIRADNCHRITGFWYKPGTVDPGYMHLVYVSGHDVMEAIIPFAEYHVATYLYQGEIIPAPHAEIVSGWIVSEGKNVPIGNLPYPLPPGCTEYIPMFLNRYYP